MFPDVTVTAVAAPLAVVSALLALILGRYAIAYAVRNRQGTEWMACIFLSLGNVGLVVLFLVLVAQRVYRGIDPPLFSNPFASSLVGCPTEPVQGYPCDPMVNPNPFIVQVMWAALLLSLIWFTPSIVVILREMRAGRSRRQRAIVARVRQRRSRPCQTPKYND
jgi:hypothetical protein